MAIILQPFPDRQNLNIGQILPILIDSVNSTNIPPTFQNSPGVFHTVNLGGFWTLNFAKMLSLLDANRSW
jgi:hypothetical protein